LTIGYTVDITFAIKIHVRTVLKNQRKGATFKMAGISWIWPIYV